MSQEYTAELIVVANVDKDTAWLIDTERLRLHPVTVDDAELMLSVWNDPAFIRNVVDRGIRTTDEARVAIADGAERLFKRYGYGPCCMSLKSNGVQIGICGLFKRDNLEHPDIGFAVLPDYCGQGYAGEAAAAIVDYARSEIHLETLTAIVSPENRPSIGLIEKLGMTFERMVLMPGDESEIRLYSMSLAPQGSD